MVKKIAIVFIFLAVFFIGMAILNSAEAGTKGGSENLGGLFNPTKGSDKNKDKDKDKDNGSNKGKDKVSNLFETVVTTGINLIPGAGQIATALKTIVANVNAENRRENCVEDAKDDFKNVKGRLISDLKQNYEDIKEVYKKKGEQGVDQYLRMYYGLLNRKKLKHNTSVNYKGKTQWRYYGKVARLYALHQYKPPFWHDKYFIQYNMTGKRKMGNIESYKIVPFAKSYFVQRIQKNHSIRYIAVGDPWINFNYNKMEGEVHVDKGKMKNTKGLNEIIPPIILIPNNDPLKQKIVSLLPEFVYRGYMWDAKLRKKDFPFNMIIPLHKKGNNFLVKTFCK